MENAFQKLHVAFFAALLVDLVDAPRGPCVPLAIVDSDFAKDQLVLLLREWYMHPNGQLPAYEWAFGDVNPPVHEGFDC